MAGEEMNLDERNAMLVEAYRAGKNRNEIAELGGISPQRVSTILKQLIPDYSFRANTYKTPKHRRERALENYHKKRGSYNKAREPRYDSIEADVLWKQAGVQF